MDDHRQVIRHRTASVNEYSTRYSEVIKKSRKTRPKEWRLQSLQNKQGSQIGDIVWPEGYEVVRAEPDQNYGVLKIRGKPVMTVENVNTFTPAEFLTRRQAVTHLRCGEFYDMLMEFGIAREQARQNIVISTYTEYYWKVDIHNCLHFLKLRMDSHAQYEIRQYANAIAEIIKQWLPLTWAAFNDYVLKAVTLSTRDPAVMRFMLSGNVQKAIETAKSFGWSKSSRERKEFVRKMAAIGAPNPWSRRWAFDPRIDGPAIAT
jgi:thymidylate synthase (FAD)